MFGTEAKKGEQVSSLVDTHDLLAVPYDMPIPGYKNDTVNTLRLWKASTADVFNLAEFNSGNYTDAVVQMNNAEQISMVLYPNDSSENGKEIITEVSELFHPIKDSWAQIPEAAKQQAYAQARA